jgi:Family of unknown function (DUF6582)
MAKKKKKKASGKTASGGMAPSKRNKLTSTKFAFPKERKEPLNDAKHVRNAIARFDQVKGVTDSERDDAWKRIKKAAKKFDVEVSAKSWRSLGKPAKS